MVSVRCHKEPCLRADQHITGKASVIRSVCFILCDWKAKSTFTISRHVQLTTLLWVRFVARNPFFAFVYVARQLCWPEGRLSLYILNSFGRS
jgi:hypothetical protein